MGIVSKGAKQNRPLWHDICERLFLRADGFGGRLLVVAGIGGDGY